MSKSQTFTSIPKSEWGYGSNVSESRNASDSGGGCCCCCCCCCCGGGAADLEYTEDSVENNI